MVLVYLCSYVYPAFRTFAHQKQKLCTFPTTDWFEQRVDLEHLQQMATSKAKHSVRPLILRAVCEIQPGEINKGVLTPWSLEEELQLQYYRSPVDAYSVRVQACWEVEGSSIPVEACKIYLRKSVKGQDGSALVSLQHPLFLLRPCDVADAKIHSFGRPEPVYTPAAVASARGLLPVKTI